MNKAVMISIRPKWCEKIASGKKAIEVRKTRPKLQMPFKCYIYCTRDKHLAFMQNQTGTNLIACMDVDAAIPVGGAIGNGKVIGEFTCDDIYEIDPTKTIGAGFVEDSCVSSRDIHKYLGWQTGYGWHISDLKIYDTPRELGELRRACPNSFYCESCAMYRENDGTCGNESLQIKRPTQSWCYVEAG